MNDPATGWSHPLFRLALACAPAPRHEAVLAMWMEHEHCGTGRTRWAIGCLTAALRWRVEQDWAYAALLLAAPVASAAAAFMLDNLFLNGHALPAGIHSTLQHLAYEGAAFVAALALGWHRPRTVVMTALACSIVAWSWLDVLDYLISGSPMRLWPTMHWMWTSLTLTLSAWISGAALGARLRRSVALR